MESLLGEAPAPATIADRFGAAVTQDLGWALQPDTPTAAEWEAVDQARQALSDPDWLHQKGREFVPGVVRTGGVKIQADTHLTEGVHKAAGGLLRTTLLAGEGGVADLLLSGDVLVFPEAGLDELAADLVGTRLEREPLAERARDSLFRRGIEIPGVTPEDVADAVLAARHES
jgi:lipoate-protein ligase A